MTQSPTRAPALVLMVGLALGLGTGACSSVSALGGRSAKTVRAADFAGATAAPGPAASVAAPPQPVRINRPVASIPTWEPPAQDRTLEVTSYPGEPAPSAPTAAAAERPVVLDSLVGQVNGRPIYASEILEPLEGELRVLGTDARTPAEFRQAAGPRIDGKLKEIVRDELILAEARASLPTELRQGLFRFLADIQQNLVSEQRGSTVAADESSRAETGRSLSEEARDKLDQELIGYEVSQRIDPRVNVSWRRVQQEYERTYDKYNPPATATLRLIMVPTDKPDQVEKVRNELASGRPFAEVAAGEANLFGRQSGGVHTAEFSGDYTKADIFAVPELNATARALTPGQTLGPIAYQDRTAWLHLESIKQPTGTSLYDAQLDIESRLKAERREAELTRYFDRLYERGSVSDLNQMLSRLLDVATQRYLLERQ